MSNVPLWWLLVPLTFGALIGILINSYVLLVVVSSRQATVNNLLLLHLGTLNLLLGVTFLSFSAPGLVNDTWLSEGLLCELHGILFTNLHPLVLWTVCGLNADRYYAIAAPLHYGHFVNPKKVLLCLGIGWAISLCFTIFPIMHIAPFTFNRGLGACVPNFQAGRATLWYSAGYTAFTLLLPITLIICCNVKILMIARYHRHRIASAIYEVTLSAQVTITHQHNPFFVPSVTAPSTGGPKFRSRSPLTTVLQLLGSFILLYVPYYSIILWESCITFLELETSAEQHLVLYQVVLVLFTLSPIVNGILYGVKDRNLRKTFQNYWRKKVTKSEVKEEIQARTPSTCGSRRQSLTPLGFFVRPNTQRRLSETHLESHKDESAKAKMKIKRNASEQTWGQSSSVIAIPPSRSTLLVPMANISDCDLDPGNVQMAIAAANGNFTTEQPHSKEHLTLAIQDSYNDTHPTTTYGKRKRSFLYKFFGADEFRTPKILITRALSQDDYSKGVRESGKHSLPVGSSFSKWYHHSDYNLLRDPAEQRDPNVMTQLLWEHHDNDGDYDQPGIHMVHFDSDSDADAEIENTSQHSENSSGMYMQLDSFDRLRTQSCDIDVHDIAHIESLETEFAMCSDDEDLALRETLANYPTTSRSVDDDESIPIGNGELKLRGKDLKAFDGAAERNNVEELIEIKPQEVAV